MKPAWFPDELIHAGEEHLDAHYVAGYERKAGVDPEPDLQALRALGLERSSTLIDFGAGTGTFALAAAPLCGRVVAVEVSPAMLAVLHANAGRQGVTNIEIAHAGFLSYEHHGAAADFVYSRHALHHLPDFWKALALRRIAAVLRPGGVLRLRDLIYSFDPKDAERTLEAWFAGASAQAHDGWTREELETHVRTEHSTFTWILESMLERSGFAIRQVEHHESGIYATYTCTKR